MQKKTVLTDFGLPYILFINNFLYIVQCLLNLIYLKFAKNNMKETFTDSQS